jgi:uncharacterized protein
VNLRIGLYRPGGLVRKLRSPLLLQVCREDLLAPASVAAAVARRAKGGALLEVLEMDHFQVYQEPGREQVVARQIEFLRRRWEMP